MTPTQRTRARLRELEVTNEIVERWNPHARKRVDLFNVIDIVAVTSTSTIGVQVTSGSGHAARRTKCEAEKLFWVWLQCDGRRFVVWSWSKRGARGKRKLWTARLEEASVVWNEAPTIEWKEITEAEL